MSVDRLARLDAPASLMPADAFRGVARLEQVLGMAGSSLIATA